MTIAKIMKMVFRVCFVLYTAQLFAQINGNGNGSPTTGSITFNNCCASFATALMFSDWTQPVLPPDAVITGIYPAAVMSGVHDTVTNSWLGYGTQNLFQKMTFGMATNGSSGDIGASPLGSTFNNVEFYSSGPSTGPLAGKGIGTAYSALVGQGIEIILNQSCCGHIDQHDLLSFVNVGYAIYYTAKNPRVSSYIPAPFTPPAGTGVTWSIPLTAQLGATSAGASFASLGSQPVLGFTRLSGLIQLPNKTNFNGTMTIKINKSGVQDQCNYPFLSVPTQTATYQVLNGIPQNLQNGNFSTTNCLSPRVPYFVTLLDKTNNVVGQDNWYLPDTEATNVDIGTMQEQKFTGPIAVAIPVGIISSPQGNQVITQPPGTSLTIYGTVNFPGTLNVTGPINNNIGTYNQVLVNGATYTGYPLDVNGIINASIGYCVAKCIGLTAGQTLVYSTSAQAFIPGSISTVFPSLYYQTTSIGGVSNPQRSTLALDTNSFTVTDSASPSQTNLALKAVGNPGTYTSPPASITFDAYGRETNVTPGTSISAVCGANGCYKIEADGTTTQWGQVTGCSTSNNTSCFVGVTFPRAFTTTANLSITQGVVNTSTTQCIATLNSPTVNGFSYGYSSVVYVGGGGSLCPGTQKGNWIAKGF